MPKMRKIVPVLVQPVGDNVFCGSGNSGTKYHISRDLHGVNFGPRCKSRAANIGSVFAYPNDTQVEIEYVCKRCLQYTEEVV